MRWHWVNDSKSNQPAIMKRARMGFLWDAKTDSIHSVQDNED
jgi:hypothetical protein